MRVLICLLLYSFSTVAQSTLPKPLAIADAAMDDYLKTKSPAVLTIRIINPPDSITRVSIKCTFVHFGSSIQSNKFYEFNKYGFARIVLDSRLPYQQIWLTVKGYLYAGLYINNGLNITIDANKIKDSDGFYLIGDGVQYSGIDGELNSLMNKYFVHKHSQKNLLRDQYYQLAMTRRMYSENQFLSKFDSIYQAMTIIADEFILQYPGSRLIIENHEKAKYFGYLCVAYWGAKMPDSLFGKISPFSPFFTDNEGVQFYNYFFTYIMSKKDNPVFDPDKHLYFRYSSFDAEKKTLLDSIKYYSLTADTAALTGITKKKYDLFFNELAIIRNQFHLQLIEELYDTPTSDILKIFLLKTGKNAFNLTYPEIINSISTGWCKNIAQAEFKQASLAQQQVDNLLARGTQLKGSELFIGKPLTTLPFKADLYRLDSIENVDDFIVNLKSKFAGKALVIDFWATWCAPCLKEMPFSKQLHESNPDLPIEFIYICTTSGSNLSLWKNRIAEFKISGTHIFANDKLVRELMKKFNSDGGFPTYVVIDSSGKLRPNAIEWMSILDREKLMKAVGF